jgi:hypothetical protein
VDGRNEKPHDHIVDRKGDLRACSAVPQLTAHPLTPVFTRHSRIVEKIPSRVRMFHPDCLEAVIRNLHETYQCRMYSRKLLMMGREDARNM